MTYICTYTYYIYVYIHTHTYILICRNKKNIKASGVMGPFGGIPGDTNVTHPTTDLFPWPWFVCLHTPAAPRHDTTPLHTYLPVSVPPCEVPGRTYTLAARACK